MRRLTVVAVALLFASSVALVAPGGDASAATPKCNGKTATIVGTGASPINGTAGDDVIVGTNADETINGGTGNDTICGRGGNDKIYGNGDNDTIYGEDGSDSELNGGLGNDRVYGGDGNDILAEQPSDGGDDTYSGGAGNDIILDFAGKNVAHGDSGADEIGVWGQAYGDSGDDVAVQATETSTGAGDAIAEGGSGSDGFGPAIFLNPYSVAVSGGTADGGSGDDYVVANLTGDVALGGSGSDVVFTSNGTFQTVDCGSAYDVYGADPTDTVRRCEALGN